MATSDKEQIRGFIMALTEPAAWRFGLRFKWQVNTRNLAEQ